jgi:hypothetical protein
MARLPFVVEPRLKPIIDRVGTEESGIVEIERRGYLTAGEKNFVQQVQQSDSSANAIIGLARKVAREYSIGLEQAYNTVTAVITGGAALDDKIAAEVEVKFADEIQSTLNDLTNSQSKADLVQAACMVIHRIDKEFQIEDVVKLHPDIIVGLAQLYRDEEARSIEKLKESNNSEESLSIEEIEKKPSRKKADG